MDTPRAPDRFGRTLLLRDGDLALRDGDLVLTAGQPELAQALTAMIETPLGSDIFNVNYGFNVEGTFVQPQGQRLIQALIRLNLIRSLSLDDRVLEVREVVFDDDPRFFNLVAGADPAAAREAHKADRRFRAAVVLATIDNAELTLGLEGPTP